MNWYLWVIEDYLKVHLKNPIFQKVKPIGGFVAIMSGTMRSSLLDFPLDNAKNYHIRYKEFYKA